MSERVRTLTLVVCAAPLAERTADTARVLVEAGWQVRVVVTPAARDWVPTVSVEAVVGSPVVTAQRRFDEPRLWPEDVATVVAPLSFNTMNKWALGISDNYALGTLNESISLHRRTHCRPDDRRAVLGPPGPDDQLRRPADRGGALPRPRGSRPGTARPGTV